MSLYSVIGIAVMALATVTIVILKIVMRRRRKKLDGLHGFGDKETFRTTKTDNWPDL